MELDPRIVEVGIEVRGQLKLYRDLQITASGTKFANGNQNTCDVTIFNLDRDTQDYIVTETSPWNLNRTPKQLVINAGRVSYGTSRIFTGNIISATPATDPPDIGLTIKALMSDYQKGTIVSRNQPGNTQLSKVAQGIAQDLGLPLNFQAAERMIANYNFSGASIKQVDLLGQLGNINAFVDDGELVVKDADTMLAGRTRIISAESGMIGIPKTTELGVSVKFLLDNTTKLGGALDLRSVRYPSLNGIYIIYQLAFDIASRDTPFYWIAEAKKHNG